MLTLDHCELRQVSDMDRQLHYKPHRCLWLVGSIFCNEQIIRFDTFWFYFQLFVDIILQISEMKLFTTSKTCITSILKTNKGHWEADKWTWAWPCLMVFAAHKGAWTSWSGCRDLDVCPCSCGVQLQQASLTWGEAPDTDPTKTIAQPSPTQISGRYKNRPLASCPLLNNARTFLCLVEAERETRPLTLQTANGATLVHRKHNNAH